MNFKIIQENERCMKEQKLKKRELANLENAEIFKMQVNSIFYLYITCEVRQIFRFLMLNK